MTKSLEAAKARGCEPATLKCYRYVADRFLLPALGDKKLHKLKPKHFDALYVQMTEAGLNPSTMRKANTFAGMALKLAERNEWVQGNAARLAILPKSIRPIRNIPTPSEFAAFLDVAAKEDPVIYAYGFVMAGTGIRCGEACGLRTDDLEDGVLYVQRAVDVSHGSARIKGTKTNKTRKITLDAETARIIQGFPGPYVFGGGAPARTDLMSKRWKRVGRLAGTTFPARNCRHFHATQLLGARMPAKAVADRLGHANPTMTLDIYADSIPVHDQVAADTIAGVLESVRSNAGESNRTNASTGNQPFQVETNPSQGDTA